MKKLFIIALTVIMLFGISANTLAVSTPKGVEVNLTAPTAVPSGEVVTLTAVTLKHGSEYSDEWIGAAKVSTVLTEDGYYISTAQVIVQETSTVQYKIAMTAGNNTSFAGQVSALIYVDEPVSVVGVELKNIRPLSWMAGFYTGDIYVIYSDGTKVYNEGFVIFSQTLKVTEVTFWENNIQYHYFVPVSAY